MINRKAKRRAVTRVDERAMLAALKDGDEGALGWFMERYAGYAYAIIERMLLPGLPRSDAEEALADVFISLWRSAKQVPEGAVRPYIAAMARNRARDALRARHAELPLEEAELEIPGRSPEQALTESETRERTRRAVESMGEPDREIFLRHYYYFQSVADIALALDMNVNTVKTRLRRGRERLRNELAREETT